jgi:molecular chaperone DnaJ
MNEENFYTILGVESNATQEDIKKAFREKSKLHHPDKGGSEDTFKKINEAYSTLSDEQKRHQYDNKGKNPFGFGGHDMSDIFEQMFNFGGRNQPRRQGHQDKIIEFQITPVESYLSTEKTIQFVRKEACNTCNGKGGDRITCSGCKGQGFFAQAVNNGFFQQVVRSVCQQCSGNGYTFRNRCFTCQGTGTKDVGENLSVKIPHGMDDGQFLKVHGKGDFSNGGYGNLLLKIKMIPSDGFEKLNNDLIYNINLTLKDLEKDDFSIPHPSGEINIKFPEEFDTAKPLRVRGKGYQGQTPGDLFIKMNVKYKRNN